MNEWELMNARHSVRAYKNTAIEEEKVRRLQAEIEQCNRESGLRIQLFTEEPEAFQAGKAHYGAFRGCKNYFAIVGEKGKEEAVGYYGERLVLLSQSLGLNTCWVALTYKKGKVTVNVEKDETLYVVIALGYGETEGVPHRSKPVEKVADVPKNTPTWYMNGVRAALTAPTAINQQQFWITLTEDGKVKAVSKWGPCSKIDLGIVKLHFEWGAGKENFEWA